MSKFVMTGQDYFGKYCLIEMHNYYSPNELFIHKCVGLIRSNTFCDVPLVCGVGEVTHDHLEDVLLVIQCGIDESKVIRVPLKDVEFCKEDGSQSADTCEVEIGHDYTAGWWVCKSCGTPFDMVGALACRKAKKPNYCPGCGAKVIQDAK